MRSIILLIVTYFLSIQLITAQKTAKIMHNSTVIDKWMKAIINIEGRADYTDSQTFKDMNQKFFDHVITGEEFVEFTMKLARQVDRFTGTAIFFKNKNKHYLITARHVLEDTNLSQHNPDSDRIFSKILLIANGSQFLEGDSVEHDVMKSDNIMLMNYNSGPNWSRPFNFSSKEDDLAILQIDYEDRFQGKEFVTTLIKRGYVPIEISDIDVNCSIVTGQQITALGFTGDASVVTQKNLSLAEFNWESDLVSLPIVSEGTVASNQSNQNQFTGNIFVYTGNSGGPIISNGKLVGIVSNITAPFVKVKTSVLNYYISRNINFVKSSLILPMLQDLENRLADPWKYMIEHRSGR